MPKSTVCRQTPLNKKLDETMPEAYRQVFKRLQPYSFLLLHDYYGPQGNLPCGTPFVSYDDDDSMVFIGVDGLPLSLHKNPEYRKGWLCLPILPKMGLAQLRDLFKLALEHAVKSRDPEMGKRHCTLFPGYILPDPEYLGVIVVNKAGVGAFVISNRIQRVGKAVRGQEV
jgi:hypothetical protein